MSLRQEIDLRDWVKTLDDGAHRQIGKIARLLPPLSAALEIFTLLGHGAQSPVQYHYRTSGPVHRTGRFAHTRRPSESTEGPVEKILLTHITNKRLAAECSGTAWLMCCLIREESSSATGFVERSIDQSITAEQSFEAASLPLTSSIKATLVRQIKTSLVDWNWIRN